MSTAEPSVYSIKFDGKVLERGFWLYVIDIHSPAGRYVYVGRTGDSSSVNAASPFARIGQHLDLRPNAKGNALLRNLRQAGVEPSTCALEMMAVGPIFPEQGELAAHRRIRDQVAALEWGLAQALGERGYTVLGKHSASSEPDRDQLESIVSPIMARLAKAEEIEAR